MLLSMSTFTGSDLEEAVAKGLHNSTCLVTILTSGYLTSSYCSKELCVANSDSKPIFPVIFEDIDLELSVKSTGEEVIRDVIGGLCWSYFRPIVDNYAGSLSWLMQRIAQNGQNLLCNMLPSPSTDRKHNSIRLVPTST